jgi:Clostripain family
MGFLQDIADELKGFAAWLWNIGPPERKPWCAAFYFVAQEDATLTYPEQTLDQKMLEAVAAITLAAPAVKDSAHVVYRTVPSDPIASDPVAKVVRFLGPETGTVFFPDCYDPSTLSLLDTEKDLTCFLNWVYRWCPADHYAIFIWGHSFGPAGLFEPGSGLKIPKPGLAALKEAFRQFQATRIAGDRPPLPPLVQASRSTEDGKSAPGATSPGATGVGQAIEALANEVDKKVEIVLFQDCWMSTLETAFEIADSTARMVASQSLIPIGRHYANFVWPYEDLLKALAAPSFAEDMTNLIVKFYVDNFGQVQYLPTIPVTLLDLSKVPGLAPPVSTLVAKLYGLPPAERRPLMEPARVVTLDSTNPYDPILLAGDGALLDILKLCAALKSVIWPAQGSGAAQAAAQQAVADVETELKKLVKLNKEAHPAATVDLGFQGVSVFHWPPVGVATDDLITEPVRRSVSAYMSLEFVKQTGWNQLGLEHKR